MNIKEDMLNMVLEVTIGKKVFKYTYSYLMTLLPYKKENLMLINKFLISNNLIKISNEDDEFIFEFNKNKIKKEVLNNLMLIGMDYKFIKFFNGDINEAV